MLEEEWKLCSAELPFTCDCLYGKLKSIPARIISLQPVKTAKLNATEATEPPVPKSVSIKPASFSYCFALKFSITILFGQ